MIQKQLYRGAALRGMGNKIQYLSELSIGLIIMGAVALQAKEIAKGRNPRDMTDSKVLGSSTYARWWPRYLW